MSRLLTDAEIAELRMEHNDGGGIGVCMACHAVWPCWTILILNELEQRPLLILDALEAALEREIAWRDIAVAAGDVVQGLPIFRDRIPAEYARHIEALGDTLRHYFGDYSPMDVDRQPAAVTEEVSNALDE